ncbi:hypothetical protein [Streptomyces sp. CT34]|uniref:hypothetical protein n=1 Tax=Streptomyces sp. CT34 TaxID=1553907 RepID=UPI0005BCAD28|nr:hypothetical protein [Streptomyces sp. CT34]
MKVAPDTWLPLLLFVIPANDLMHVAVFRRNDATWPPPAGALYLERAATGIVRRSVGKPLTVTAQNGVAHTLQVAATVHDPALAPAPRERTGSGYITPATLHRLGIQAPFDELEIVVADGPHTAATTDTRLIERRARALASGLAQRGATVEEIQIPPPHRHPHQSILDSMIGLLLGPRSSPSSSR